jgi:chaperone required for assembly of F1-ATPase
MLHGRTLIDHIAKHAETDLVCHRAEAPGALIQRQKAVWDPICKWAEEYLGVRLPVVTGIIAAEASPDIALLRSRADSLDDFRLTGLAQAVGLSGSALIGFALLEGRLGAEGAFNAAALDDIWSQETWGLDEEAQARLEHMRGEFHALEKFFTALR